MDTTYSDQIRKNFSDLSDQVWIKGQIVDKILIVGRTIGEGDEQISEINEEVGTQSESFISQTFWDSLSNEISKNILLATDKFILEKYLHYLCKIHGSLTFKTLEFTRKKKDLEHLFRGSEISFKGSYTWKKPYEREIDLIYDYYHTLKSASSFQSEFRSIICREFGIKNNDFYALFFKETNEFFRGRPAKLIVSPLLVDMKKFFSEIPVDENTEQMPEFEFQTINQKIAWLYELGIVNQILLKSSIDNLPNFYRASNILASFTDLKPATIRKSIEAIFKPNAENEKNNPFKNKGTKIFIEQMKEKFKLNKEQ